MPVVLEERREHLFEIVAWHRRLPRHRPVEETQHRVRLRLALRLGVNFHVQHVDRREVPHDGHRDQPDRRRRAQQRDDPQGDVAGAVPVQCRRRRAHRQAGHHHRERHRQQPGELHEAERLRERPRRDAPSEERFFRLASRRRDALPHQVHHYSREHVQRREPQPQHRVTDDPTAVVRACRGVPEPQAQWAVREVDGRFVVELALRQRQRHVRARHL